MDFRGVSKHASTRLAVPTTVLTPQLESNDIFRGYRKLEFTSENKKQPFMLAFNLASVAESELKITRRSKSSSQDVLQLEVIHLRKEAEGVHPFARDCTYRIILPEDLYDKPLTALWTYDQHLIVVESSNFMESLTDAPPGTKDAMDVDTQVEGESVEVIKPRKVNCVFKPTVDVDVMRRSVTLAEQELFHVKRIIQNGSFSCPNIVVDSPDSTKKKDHKYIVVKETEILPLEGYFIDSTDVIKEE